MRSLNITIVGGGSTWTLGILNSMIKNIDKLPLNKVTLYDNDEARQAAIGEAAKILFKEKAPQVDFSYTIDSSVAFTDVDFIFAQMRTGGYKMREMDEKIPMKYGVIGQETCGPGGFAYGLRSIGDMIEMVNNVRLLSPDAWILNYSNPAAIVAEALNREFPDDNKILNICDQPVNLLRSYANLLKIDEKEMDPIYFGLNHFGWFTNIYDSKGIDLVPQLKKIIIENGFAPVDAEQRDQSWLEVYAMVEKMVIDFPDYLPNTYLQYYLYPQTKFKKLNPNHTRANEVMEGREKRVFEECAEIIKTKTTKGSKIVHNDAHGDLIVELASSIAFNNKQKFIIITENNGLINNIQNNAMVEVTAEIGANGARPIGVGNIPTFYKGLIEQQLAYEKLAVDAYFEKSYNKALQSLTLNKMIGDGEIAKAILNDLIEANSEYWPKLEK